jgi:hypothetical protein
LVTHECSARNCSSASAKTGAIELAASTTIEPFRDSSEQDFRVEVKELSADEEAQADMPISKKGNNRRKRTL